MVLRYLIISTCALFLCSCGKITTDIEWTPVFLRISLENEYGQDLANPDDKDLFIGDEIVIIFRGEEYRYDDKANNSETSSLSLFFKKSAYSYYYLTFGPINGAFDYDEDIILRRGGKIMCVVHYYCANHSEPYLSCTREWYFNGEKTTIPLHLKQKRK